MWDGFIKFVNDNKDALTWIFGSGVGIALITGIYSLIVWILQTRRNRNKRTDNSAFKVMHPNSNITKEILGGDDNDKLIDRNIPYQQRVKERNIRREIEETLEKHKWILVAGKTGIGKTREVLNVAQSLSNEGWTVLFFTREQWLDAPPHLPESVPDRKLLFILDDLNRKMYASRVEQSPQANDIGQPATEPLQKRLLRTLETFETLCGKDEIRVIATARSETVREYPDEPSEWEKLEIDAYPQLWKRFYNYPLPEPKDDSIVGLFEQTESSWLSSMNSDDLRLIAKRNDQTFANVVENLRRAQNRKEPLSKENFVDSLKGTWQSRYEDVTKRYPEAKFVYAAIKILRSAEIELFDFMVKPVAALIAGGNLIQKVLHKFKIAQVLMFLEKTENILKPRDGQIEASTLLVELNDYIDSLGKLLLDNPNREKLLRSFQGFAQVLYTKKLSLDLAEKLINTAIEAKPDLSTLLNDLGAVYIAQGRKEEAIQVYQKSSELFPYCLIPWFSLIQEGEIQEAQKAFDRTIKTETNPSEQVTQWKNLGLVYRSKGFYPQAIDAYKTAIKLMPNNVESWQGLGDVYFSQKNFKDCIEPYKKAVELEPSNTNLWKNLGQAYFNSEQYDNAIDHYLKAIEIDPQNASHWNALGAAHYYAKHYTDAIMPMLKATEYAPNDSIYWTNLGKAYSDTKQFDDAIKSYQKAIEIDPKDENRWAALSNLFFDLGKSEEGLIYFNQAVEHDPNNASAYHQIGHMRRSMKEVKDAISAFKKAIELEPKEAYHYKCLGDVYRLSEQDEDAINSYQRAIELEPKDASVWINIGIVYKRQMKYQDAINAQKRACDLNPNEASDWHQIGVLSLLLKDLNEALLAFQKAIEIDPQRGMYHASLTSTLRKLGRDIEASDQEKVARPLMEVESEYNRACFEAICGNTDNTVELLKIALEKKQTSLEWCSQDPDFDFIREDPRFKELVGLE